MIPGRVPFRYDFIPVPYWVSIFIYMIPTKISFPKRVIAEWLHPGSRAGSNSSWTFHKYHVKEVRAHSGTELGKWLGLADQLTIVFDQAMFLPHFFSRMSTSSVSQLIN